MDPEISLERVDVDGAVRETAHEAAEALDSGDTRLSFLKKAGLAGGAVMGSGALLGESITPDGAFAKPADVKTVLKSVEPFLVE